MRIEYNIYFETSAAFFMFFLAMYVRLQYNLNTKRNKSFYSLMLIVLLADILDVVTGITVSNVNIIPLWFNLAINSIYMFVDGHLGYQALSYSLKLEEEASDNYKESNFLNWFRNILLLVYIVLLLINLFTGFIFNFSNGEYQHGKAYILIFIVPYIYFVLSIIVMLKAVRKKPAGQRIAIILYGGVSMSGAILQIMVFPDVLLNIFTIVLGTVIILFFLESKEYSQMVKLLDEMQRVNETANKVVSEKNAFLASLTATISSPVKHIIDIGEEMEKIAEQEQVLKYIENIKKTGIGLLSSMDDIVEYTKIELDQLEIHSRAYNPVEMVKCCLYGVEDIAKKNNNEIVEKYSKLLPQNLYGDRERFAQIVRKFLLNALKYTDNGTITVNVQWNEVNNEKGMLIVSVEDTGTGIEEDIQKHIFDPFEQGSIAERIVNEGMGMGLAFAKGVAEKMGGEVGVYSKKGEGALFYVEIPQEIYTGE